MNRNRLLPTAPRRLVLAAGVAMLLSACADMRGIDTQSTLRTPQALGLTAEASAADQAAAVAAIDAQWWRALGDERLNQLVDQALADSPNLKAAQARIRKAWAVAQVAQAADKPQVELDANAARNQAPAHGLIPPPYAGTQYSTANAQLGGSWSLDLFGKHRAALDAAVGAARAAEADQDAARVLLASAVVQAYVQLARWQEQAQVAQRAIAQRESTLKLVRERFNAGLDTNLEVRQSESGVPEARVQLAQALEQKHLAQNALAALLGQPAQAGQLQASPLAALHALQLPQQLSARLLGRRADVVAARWRVEAADRSIAAAKAQFYPDINLTAFVGLSSVGLGNFLQGNARQWGVGPALSLPIFDAGRLRANLAGTSADYDAAVEGYNQAVINAVHDVADQIAAVQSAYAQLPQQQQAAAAAQSALDIANQRYAAGLSTYLSVLAAETNVLAQRRATVDITARVLSGNAALAQALGGGYSGAPQGGAPTT